MWRVADIRYFSGLAYLASGGFRGPQLYPEKLLLRKTEQMIWANWLSQQQVSARHSGSSSGSLRAGNSPSWQFRRTEALGFWPEMIYLTLRSLTLQYSI
jgi:hypothetical protein